jgi:hypothetical protein
MVLPRKADSDILREAARGLRELAREESERVDSDSA